MTISFITIDENTPSEWFVVKHSFPQISREQIHLYSNVNVEKVCSTEKAAELAAKAFAASNNLHYVTTTFVMTVCKLPRGYVPVKLSPRGGVKTQESTPDFSVAVKKAQQYAIEEGLTFILPHSIETNSLDALLD
ncbi:putative uncharacterized protein [Parachlamydia acanthamoebae UV-7]|jgi:hypothetical protein|uniref:Uncharacterized protein n=2 Tax=Parachlamydia acanthamoebae TaxID=83552 RepID=F8L1W0_PARAV|nr:hypothetical protein [Parachlamydia acanthamoebae]EFB40570.1 hypothetical protein pah_c200o148 [Parachlamydia acanthamoebae str. Hall's coccus]KIA77022.1 hypothetical protein DB43_GX00040 [Parachlamydia acanthamoebae]CCB87274.1 putative uncharacterized protein [Parachlamydia acanthamoebae UV-7]